ncbi:hypothetical protein E8E13_004418 [Curvularia kusanoi]|uniref:Glycosyltransferase family 32 protein n=1 Tax=Curvularia kusanoi TaxID=90978 RepID=A0A9P4T6X1_CURKU|nr:hypothetical protein E8E13_004418 [Curvularia kusanoi]
MLDQLRSLSIFRRSHDYIPLSPLPTLPRSRFAIKLVIAACILLTLVTSISLIGPVENVRVLDLLKSASSPPNEPIPSIIHYVFIKKDADSVIKFPFASFLTLFASVMYIKPTQIYIHTDYNETEIRNASIRGDRWTRAVINTFPELLQWHGVIVPEFAGPNENQRISAIQHKSDFIRWEGISQIGGIYLDWDVFPLRPLTPLLNSGFAFVGGRQYGGAGEDGQINGTINNGAFMTKPNSTMARIVVREQHAGFNGAWASNLHLMTVIAEHLVTIPNEVLILDRNSFAPTHWFPDSPQGTEALFRPQPGRPSPEPIVTNTTDPMKLYDDVVLNRRRRAEWEMDFSSTYLLHAFSTGHHLEFINPKTILSRTSNFGVATYDVVKKMREDGLITGEEDGTEKEVDVGEVGEGMDEVEMDDGFSEQEEGEEEEEEEEEVDLANFNEGSS